jgi:hypothetical protein
MPLFVLQRMLMGNLPQGAVEACQATAMDFVVEQIETISRDALASRLCLNTESSYVEPQKIFLQNIKVAWMVCVCLFVRAYLRRGFFFFRSW